MPDRELMTYQAAAMHYRDGQTMESVARRFGVSRSTVSRLLKEAKDAGIVTITVAEPTTRNEDVQRLERIFDVDVVSIPTAPDADEAAVLDSVARAAAGVLTGWVSERPPGLVVGIAWGRTLSKVVAELDLVPCGAVVVQMNGAVNPVTSGQPYAGEILSAAARAWRGKVMHFPVPAFFDFTETKDAMWRERSVRHVLKAQDQLDIAVFGVGALSSGTQSQVYVGGYLLPEDVVSLLEAGVVGDVNTVMLRADGTFEGIELNSRASGMSPDRLRAVDRRLCVAAGSARTAAVLAALRAGLVTTLVADSGLVGALASTL